MSDTSTRRDADPNAPIPFRAAEGLQITTTSMGKGATRTHFVRAKNGEIVQLGEEEYFIFSMLDGRPSLADIQREFRERFSGELSRRHFQEFVNELSTAGVIERVPGAPAGDFLADEPEPAPAEEAEKPGDSNRAAARRAQRARAQAVARAPATSGTQASFLTLAALGSPLRYFALLLIPAMAIALYALFGADPKLGSVHAMLDGAYPRAISFWRIPVVAVNATVALLVVLVVPRLASAAAAAYHGAPPATFSWYSVGGVSTAGVRSLTRKGRAWTYGAPIVARAALFVLGAWLWGGWQDESGAIPTTGFLLSQFGLWSFLITANPLWPGDGRRWLAAYFDEPRLLSAMTPDDSHGTPVRGRGFLAVAGLILLLAMAGAALPWLQFPGGLGVFGRAGAIMLGVAYAAGLIWMWAARVTTPPLIDVPRSYSPGAFGRAPFARSVPLADDGGDRPISMSDRMQTGRMAWRADRTPFVLAGLIAIGIAILFLPYPYESGGSFTVLPYGRTMLQARVSGELTEILVREGEWVNEGEVVATLSDWNEVHELAVAQAALDAAQSELQNLLISPKPEEVEVARKQYEQALSRLPYSKSQYERYLALVKTGDVSVQQYESALSTYQQDQAAVGVTRANYEFVRVGPTQAQIAQVRAAVEKAAAQVSYWKDQLNRTRIRATASGTVVTPDPQLMMGQYLQTGTTALTLEDHRVAHVAVLVPEYDIRDIHLGSRVRARAWGYEYTTWEGKTTLIAPDAQPNGTMGNVVRVIAEIPNPDGLLRPTMTGEAKVQTVDMPVWMAFSRAIVRFILVEMWYWIP
ncbi:MAG: efflux RND transporter periplasmic adaptor subunit [Proteobacteria bacterium]|nr:efflux RND transporter periplasmic adaptor subunit [Pseudomonadota bacterium]